MNGKILLILILLPALLSGCSDDSGTNPDNPSATISDEAQLAALWLTNEIKPPLAIALQIENDLKRIRTNYADSMPIFNQVFIYPVPPKNISVTLTDSAVSAIRADTFTAWDDLNQSFGINRINTNFNGNNKNYVRLYFEEHWNPSRVAPFYYDIEGVRHANPALRFGDYSNFYPWYVDGEIAYLFREGWGDCPSGCMYNHFWYVKKINGEWTIIGDFEKEYQKPYPDWWDEISEAYWSY